jgi:glycosyltransferase involved in cell wall biosynthesis
MARVSVIVPSRNEIFLKRTVDDIFAKAVDDIEVIVVVDGATIYSLPKERPNLIFLKNSLPEGLRPAMNNAANIASGKYIMRIDAHCAIGLGFDEILKKNIEDNWIVVPRHYELDVELWQPKLETVSDYRYLGFPWNSDPFIIRNMKWYTRDLERSNSKYDIDDQMTFPGCVWFTSKNHYVNRLGGMTVEGYGKFAEEMQQIGLKTWLGGGKVMINKKVWFAHWAVKEKLRTSFPLNHTENIVGCIYNAHYWTENKWYERKYDFDWIIEKFWPLPSPGHRTNRERYSWPLNWRDYYEKKL